MSFSRYATEDSVISAETVVRGLWTGDAYTLLSTDISYTAAGSNTEYYMDVYNNILPANGGTVQYSIEYGNLNGSGSAFINSQVPGYSPSRVIYGQYRNLVYGTEDTNFSFDGGTTTAQQIHVINISRDRYKQSLSPGSFNLSLTSGSGGNINTLYLTDDSNTTSLTRFIGENRVYYIISGSNGNYCTSCNSGSIYGMMLPDLGIIILDTSGSAFRPYISASNVTSNPTYGTANNAMRLWQAIATGSGYTGFHLRSSEVVSSRYFFTRVKNSEFNYTTNPSIIDNNGNLLYSTLINNPQTFVTTVGMYNDNNELLAVAKLSKPLTKDFTKEALIRIKLDY